jgi:hypothetical protein
MMSCSNGLSTASVWSGCNQRSLVKPPVPALPPGEVFRVRNFSTALRSSSAHSRPFLAPYAPKKGLASSLSQTHMN